MIVCSALMIWKSLMVVTSSESPVVVVLRYRCSARGVRRRPTLAPPPGPTPPSGMLLAATSGRAPPNETRTPLRPQRLYGASLSPRRHSLSTHGVSSACPVPAQGAVLPQRPAPHSRPRTQRPRTGRVANLALPHGRFTPFRAGDIVVFKVQDREIPIVHRVIKVRGAGARNPRPRRTRALSGSRWSRV